MDTNYSRWIHNGEDVDTDEVPVEEPARFRIRRPANSVVARGLMATLVVAGLGGIVYSSTTPDASTESSPIETTPTDETDGTDDPGAAAIEDSTTEDSTEDSVEVTTTDDSDDESTDDEDFVAPRPARRYRLEAPGDLPPGAHLEIRRAPDPQPGQRIERRRLQGPAPERLEWRRE